MTYLLTIVASTYLLFNYTAGLIGGIWLLVTGGWSVVIIGILISLIMPWTYTIALLPEMLLIWPLLSKFDESSNRILVAILSFLAVGYEKFIVMLWVTTVFDTLFYVNAFNFSSFALWLWGFSVVMGPIGYMASKEGPDAGLGTSLGVFFTQIAYFTVSLNWVLGGSRMAGYGWLWIIWLIFVFGGVTLGVLSIPKKEVSLPISNNNFDTFINCPTCKKKNNRDSLYCKHCGDSLYLDPEPEIENKLYSQALKISRENDEVSPAKFQRLLKIRYEVAARLINRLEEEGLIGPANGALPRKVL